MEFDPEAYFAPDRLEKRERLEEEGIDPYPHEFDRTVSIGEYVDQFSEQDEIDSDDTYRLAGRITGNIRDLGSITFLDISDERGSVQLFCNEDAMDNYDILDTVDRGDFVGVTGTPMRTQNGELSINVSEMEMLSKALKHPPGYEGLNEEQTLRNRAVAMWDDSLRSNLEYRFEMLRVIREYLASQDFTEVQTPVLQNIYGGTSARPFSTEANAKDSEMYLRIAKELYHKRLVVGGFERIFEIGKDFRNEDIDTTHNPEFTMMELYQAYADYEDIMSLTEDLVVAILDELNDGEYAIEYHNPVRTDDGHIVRDEEGTIETEVVELDFSPPWPRLSVEEALVEYADINPSELSDEELRERALEAGGEFPGGFSRGLAIMELFEALVEHKLTGPVFIVDHPVETTPLSKDHRDKEGRIERFELFVAGAEVGNAYTELNDPIQQGEHFAEQMKRREEGDEEAHQMDEDFVEALGYGMPPTGGLGIGIDRLAMILTDSQSIKDVLPFPMVASE
ncbi:lysine--tRNA ligase [Halovenus marina]|uniref:lysine--tRNA ligase n=1 Tax=Halovenus marina TaxID=3396621 RepID=UPI003F54D3D7